jgi:putative ABC transport system permease protein
VGVAEKALLAVSALVVLVGLAGLVAAVVAGLGERRRELAILRSLGASPRQVFLLLALEGLVLTVSGCLLGLALLYGGSALAGPWLEARYGFTVHSGWPSASEWALLGAVLGAGLLASPVPGLRAYRYSLADGMTVRV